MELKPWEFWELTWVDYWRMREGFHRRQEWQWLHTREVIASIYNHQRTKKDERIKSSDIITLSFDKVKGKPMNIGPRKLYYSREEIEDLKKKFKISNG